ncbi:D-aminoacyl-tRNA deacylase [Inhella gelatinilytica]|uniref:D-aminoacyl-tRNA deacylase n=1 Tax=Inhella gelatinilytica TaxID=2795030 RepID=A0A931IZ71_9BURK|nr:D-aminoacyl-tRNA deacylase [Inhella gelatinilytica]MBH9553273.1 D-tyrosyl-tRNA(Tyr) deacylase [Inhella gelatinilytica]
MKSVLQRVKTAQVTVDGAVVGAIGPGLLALVCAEPHDTPETANRWLNKVLKLRIFSDDAGKMNRSLTDTQGGLLLVSQFTLAADCSGGNRPSFSSAAPPDQARTLYLDLIEQARSRHPQVAAGVFAADMQVQLINDGPVTIPLNL